ncbi:hypothetical protein [Armatimonas sp.]|uniref:hypothetical protein n=1 Tax=Armatimonas sp. TaxID=1872638 RepID=UPI00286CC3E8|nr:hypothetical protein [Armatimonas sp.]
MIFPRLRCLGGASLIVFGMLLSPALAQVPVESNLKVFNYTYTYTTPGYTNLSGTINLAPTTVTRTIPVKIYIPAAGTYNSAVPLPVVTYLHGAGERGNGTDVNEGNVDGTGLDSWAFSDSLQLIDRPAIYIAPRGIASFGASDPEYLENNARWGSTASANYGYNSFGEFWLNNYGASDAYNYQEFPISASLRGAMGLPDYLTSSSSLTDINGNSIALPLMDSNRQYLVGWSSGGDGVWDAVVRAPHKYAAAIPVSGVGDPGAFFGSNAVAGLESQAVRAFAGSLEVDDLGNPNDQQTSIAKMQAAMSSRGAIGTAQILPGQDHFTISNAVFGDPANRDWLFAQSSAVVPEPATLAFYGVGLFVLRCRRKA